VFGVFAPDEDVARIAFYGLYALQHRGQESAGIATGDGRQIHMRTGMGLVSQVFDENDLPFLPGFVAIGRIRAPRGLVGELKVEPLTDFPDRFAPGETVWVRGRRLVVEGARWHHKDLLLKLEGIDRPEDADDLRGCPLEVPESELRPLADGQFYRFQVVGLRVYDREGHALGEVVEVLPTGSNDVYVVRGELGELLVPAIDDVVKEVDIGGGRMVVELMEGMLPGQPEKQLP
jgi:16S rRNA processing protein RimM